MIELPPPESAVSMTSPAKVILIAEDSADEVILMSRIFAATRLPFELRFVRDGHEAIEYLERRPPYDSAEECPLPSVIIVDLKMPLLDGFDLLAWLKVQPVLREIPTVVHTSSTIREDRERARHLGARDYFVKGSGPGELAVMFKAIGDKWLGGASTPTLTLRPEPHGPTSS